MKGDHLRSVLVPLAFVIILLFALFPDFVYRG
jgi:hypothetical protein